MSGRFVNAETIHLSLLESTLINPAIWPDVLSSAMFLVIEVISLIAASVIPGEDTLAMHHVKVPFAFILSTICPFVFAKSMDIIV
jgi:hypothetical protein